MLRVYLEPTEDHEGIEFLLEHSLVSLSKWESFYEKPFYGREEKTTEEAFKYIEFMVLNTDVIPHLNLLRREQFEQITGYINSKQSATWFNEVSGQPKSTETITSELIYYWLTQFRIPFQPTESWHLNRIMTLIKIAGIKQTKPKKMSAAAQAEQYRSLNEQRKRQLGTNG